MQKILLLNDFTGFYQLTATVRQGEVTQQAVTEHTLEASHQLLCGNLSVTSTEKHRKMKGIVLILLEVHMT